MERNSTAAGETPGFCIVILPSPTTILHRPQSMVKYVQPGPKTSSLFYAFRILMD